jgi:methyl-accepting chemotaxis protein
MAKTVRRDGVVERVVALRTNAGRWRVVAHLPNEDIVAPYDTARIAIIGGAAALLVVLLLLLVSLHQFLLSRITIPARELAEAAEAVAAGDFSVQLRHTAADDEIGRLSRAVGAMILELKRLAQAIAGSARETSAMSSEITAGSEQMAATAGEIANTASDLSGQATSMAETISSLANSANALQELAVQLDGGAREGVLRNTTLRSLALENRAGLDASAGALSSLAENVQESAESIEALGAASEEIRSFVTLVRKLARQSKLLALNAAMEAARAGVHGQGFAVVASEVRRLAAMSSDAAEQTETIVKTVLMGITTSRSSADRAVGTAAEVRSATSLASESFMEIERAVAESEAWTATIAHASTATSSLVAEVTERLQSLAGGTESFAAAMQQVAASSQEQSASTEEIAGAANTLGAAADRLSKLVGGLKTVEG